MTFSKMIFQSTFLHYCSCMTNWMCLGSFPISPRWRFCSTSMENLNSAWFRQVSQTLWYRIRPAVVEIYPQNQSKSFGRVYLFLGRILNILQNQSPTRFCRRRSREKYILSGWIEIALLGRSWKSWRCRHQDVILFCKLASGRRDIGKTNCYRAFDTGQNYVYIYEERRPVEIEESTSSSTSFLLRILFTMHFTHLAIPTLASLVAVQAHPGHDINEEIAHIARAHEFHKRDISSCYSKLKARGHHQRTTDRRHEILKNERAKRGLPTGKPPFIPSLPPFIS